VSSASALASPAGGAQDSPTALLGALRVENRALRVENDGLRVELRASAR
jgi:hypothetical protein